MKLLELYEALLKTAGLVTTSDGFVSKHVDGLVKPATIKGKRVVLPTPTHLANPDKTEIILFHPLSENIMHGESVVLEEFRSGINNKLNFTIGLLCYQLLLISTSVAEHSKLSPDQLEFLSKLKNADEKTLETFNKILKATGGTQKQNTFVSIFLKRGGVVGGKKRSRAGIVSFPFYTDLKKNESEVFGVKMRVKDRETFINLMEYIFPTIDVPESHNRGSDALVGPSLDALMKTVIGIAGPLNDQITLFANIIDDSEAMMINGDWVESFDNIDAMNNEVRMIPIQAGNEGSSVNAGTAVTPPPAPAPTQPINQQPAWQPQQQLTPQGYLQPPAAPAPIITSRGLDFASAIRSNPALAQTLGYNNPNYGIQSRPMNTEPRWGNSGNPYQQNNNQMYQNNQQQYGNQPQYGGIPVIGHI